MHLQPVRGMRYMHRPSTDDSTATVAASGTSAASVAASTLAAASVAASLSATALATAPLATAALADAALADAAARGRGNSNSGCHSCVRFSWLRVRKPRW